MSGSPQSRGHAKASLATLTLGALGVVYGDIGTSPLYTMKECLHAGRHHHPARDDVLGILSLMFWSLTMVVTLKYVVFVLRADNKGEGGPFSLLAIVPKALRERGTSLAPVAILVTIGAALLFGDSVITPAISVLSAMEGLAVAEPRVPKSLILGLTCAILVGLFAIQSRGTGAVGKLFGPVMVVWFTTLASLGAMHLVKNPSVLEALSPHHAVRYLGSHGATSFRVLGSVVLAVTGGESLYADMGHFGAKPIRLAWVTFVMPALVLAYFGQGALVLAHPEAAASPFFSMVPTGAPTYALVALSSCATVIASQAVISGAYSLTRQAMQLGYFPRVTVRHTADHTEGQIYVPEINWLLALGCIVLVLTKRESSSLAAAYGLAVTGSMTCTSILYAVVARSTWGWSAAKTGLLVAVFLSFDLPFLSANVLKIPDGGYIPLFIGAAFVTSMLIWRRGRLLLSEQYAQRFPPFDEALPRIEQRLVARVPGTAVFMASNASHVPPVLMHHVERSRTLHENVVMLTVRTAETPYVPSSERVELSALGGGFHRVLARYGFMEQPNVVAILELARAKGLAIDTAETTYYLGRETIVSAPGGKMGSTAEKLFAFLQRNALTADRHFGVPPKQVVELGTQVDL